MNKKATYYLIVILNLAIFTISIKAEEVLYNIYYKTDKEWPYLVVDVEFDGSKTGFTWLQNHYDWAGSSFVKHKTTPVHNQNIEIIATDNPAVSYIKHKPSEKIKLKYFIFSQTEEMQEITQILINHRYLHINGYGLFLVPIFSQLINNNITPIDNLPVNYKVKWHDMPENWHFSSSYGNHKETQVKLDDPSKLLNTIFTSGNVDPVNISFLDNNLEIIIYDQFQVPNNEIIDNIQKIILEHRKLFDDNDFPHYLVVLSKSSNKNSIHGIATNNCLSITSGEDIFEKRYKSTISHEHLHNWFGIKITPEEKGLTSKWWSEGFTDFFSYKTIFTSEVINYEQYQHLISYQLSEYFSSPYINLPNESMNKTDFWKIYELTKLPYLRGSIFALMCDNILRKSSNNQFSLNNVMRDLYYETKNRKIKFSSKLLISVLNRYNQSINWERMVDMYIYKGQTMNIPVVFLTN